MALDCSRSPSSPSRSHWRLREGGSEGGKEGGKEGGREGGRGEGREEFRKWEVQCDWIELCIV